MFVVAELSILYLIHRTRRTDSEIWKESSELRLVGDLVDLTELSFEMSNHGFYLDHSRCKQLTKPLKGHSIVVVLGSGKDEKYYPLPEGMMLSTPIGRMVLAM